MNVNGSPVLPRLFSAVTRRSPPRLFRRNTGFAVSTACRFSSENRIVRYRTILSLWFRILAGRIKSRIRSILEKRRNPALPLPPPGGSSLPYGRRRDDAETAHIRKWVGLADAALELNQPNTGGLKGNQTFSRSNVTRVFEIFFGPKRRRSVGGRALRGDLLV